MPQSTCVLLVADLKMVWQLKIVKVEKYRLQWVMENGHNLNVRFVCHGNWHLSINFDVKQTPEMHAIHATHAQRNVIYEIDQIEQSLLWQPLWRFFMKQLNTASLPIMCVKQPFSMKLKRHARLKNCSTSYVGFCNMHTILGKWIAFILTASDEIRGK